MSRRVTSWTLIFVFAIAVARWGRTAAIAPGQAADVPSTQDYSEGVVTLASPGARAAAELVADTDRLAADGRVILRVHNRGESAISYGRPIQVERLDGETWVETTDSRNAAWTLELLIVQPGQAGVEQPWPFTEAHRPEPGWYRFTKYVQAEPSGGESRQTPIRARVVQVFGGR